jgi:protein-S-isoprenylcysteine O-methyltransferase Ste14
MAIPRWIAAVVLFMQLPIPLYWFVVHPAKDFWRGRGNVTYVAALGLSWLPVSILLVAYRRELLRSGWPAAWQFILGLALILLEVWIFLSVRRDLGGARLVGATEISSSGQIEQAGIYSRVRHPRYTGSFLALIGACLIAGTRATWTAVAIWTILTAVAIGMEEKELCTRFGNSYQEYCRRVPRFVPWLKT